MPGPEIEEFVRILVEEVRDAAIRSNDAVLQPNTTHAVAKRWREAGFNGHLKSIASVVIPDVVDDTIFYLLHAIDEGLLKLSFTASNGKQVDLCSDGFSELVGGTLVGTGLCSIRKSDSSMTFPTCAEATLEAVSRICLQVLRSRA